MTREELIKVITRSADKSTCPSYPSCNFEGSRKNRCMKCAEKQLEEYEGQIINKAIDKFAEILSNIPNICGRQCPVKCNWGTEDSCKEMCKKWLSEQLKDK